MWCDQTIFRLNFYFDDNCIYCLFSAVPLQVFLLWLDVLSPVAVQLLEAFVEVLCFGQPCSWVMRMS